MLTTTGRERDRETERQRDRERAIKHKGLYCIFLKGGRLEKARSQISTFYLKIKTKI